MTAATTKKPQPAAQAPAPDAGQPSGMYLQSLKLSNFRSCYDTTVEFQPTLTLLVGENNSGKSNVIEALRLATAPLNLRRTRFFEPEDRSHGRSGPVELDFVLDDLTDIQQAQYITALDIKSGQARYKARFRPDQDVPKRSQLSFQRTIRELVPVLSLCDQVDLLRYGRSAGLAVLGWPGERAQAVPERFKR